VLSSFFVGIKNPDNSTHYKQFLKEVKCDFPLRPEGRSLQVDIKGVLADELTKVHIPELENILQNELKDWQKRFAKSLRTMGRYSFAIVSAEDLYGKREVFNMYG
jgi:hypothetical protein